MHNQVVLRRDLRHRGIWHHARQTAWREQDGVSNLALAQLFSKHFPLAEFVVHSELSKILHQPITRLPSQWFSNVVVADFNV